MKQNKKRENLLRNLHSRKNKLLFYVYDVIVKQFFWKRSTNDDDVFYLFLQKQKIGAELQHYLSLVAHVLHYPRAPPPKCTAL